MISSLLIAILVGLPGVLLNNVQSKFKYVMIALGSLMCAAAITLANLPDYCVPFILFGYASIFFVYILMLIKKTVKIKT